MLERAQSRLLVFAVVACVCAAVGELVAGLPVDFTTTPAAVLTWAAAIALSIVAWKTLSRLSLAGLVLVYGFLGFGATAALVYQPTSTDLNGPNSAVAQMAQQTQGYRYLLIFVVGAYAIWGASLVIGMLFPLRDRRILQWEGLDVSPKVLPLAALPLLAMFYGTGVKTVFHANHYLEHTGPGTAALLGKALAPIGVLACGYFMFQRRESAVIRVSALLLALGYETIFLAQSTRFFAFWIPLVFAGGLLTGSWSVSRRRVAVFVAAITSVLALQVPLGLRNLPSHGLVPAISYLTEQPALVFGSHNPINNFLFGAPLTLFVAHDVQKLPPNDFVTSISPMPSHFNDWAQIAPSLRLNVYTPYSALGELLNRGWGFFVLLMCIFGAAFTLAERLALRRQGVVGGLSQMVVLGATALFVVESTEYNLRSVARLIYYVVVVVLVLPVIINLFRPRERSKSMPSQRLEHA
jgi:hypothetical protein